MVKDQNLVRYVFTRLFHYCSMVSIFVWYFWQDTIKSKLRKFNSIKHFSPTFFNCWFWKEKKKHLNGKVNSKMLQFPDYWKKKTVQLLNRLYIFFSKFVQLGIARFFRSFKWLDIATEYIINTRYIRFNLCKETFYNNNKYNKSLIHKMRILN